jgi:hypothetical protein
MRRWLWKELRERGGWGLCWLAAIVAAGIGVSASVTCYGGHALLRVGGGAAVLLAVLLGSTAYASETLPGRAIFVFARPVAWWRPLLGKVLSAALFILAGLLIAVLWYKLGGPERYRPLFTAEKMLLVLAIGLGALLVPYLVAMCCSVVLTGITGGIITFCAVLLVLLGEFAVSNVFQAFGSMPNVAVATVMKLIASTLLALLCAGVPLMHFGLTLTVHERVKRFALVFAAALAVLLTAGALLRAPQPGDGTGVSQAALSPDGRYLFAIYTHSHFDMKYQQYSYDHTGRILRVSDLAPVLDVPAPQDLMNGQYHISWTSPSRVATMMIHRVNNRQMVSVTVADAEMRHVRRYDVKSREWCSFDFISSNGKTAVFTIRNSGSMWTALFLHLDTGETVTHNLDSWWESDGAFAYRDQAGVHWVELPWAGKVK